MSKLAVSETKKLSLKGLIDDKRTKDRFNQVLGEKAAKFLASLLNVANNNELLKKSKPETVIKSALVAATLDLPIDNNLGFAYIVPYKDEAQFQLGYKGLLQLAMRSGQFLKINIAELKKGQLISYDPVTEDLKYDLSKNDSEEVEYYIGYFKLLNGFEKYLVMSKEEIISHAKKYSKTFSSKFSPWQSNFESMAKKTVIKQLLSKYAPLSIDMQTAVKVDQTVITEVEEDNIEVKYVDNLVEEDNIENAEEIEETKENIENIEEVF